MIRILVRYLPKSPKCRGRAMILINCRCNKLLRQIKSMRFKRRKSFVPLFKKRLLFTSTQNGPEFPPGRFVRPTSLV